MANIFDTPSAATAPVAIDLTTITEKILAIRRGDLPADAVTDDELRAALNQQRAAFAAGEAKAVAKKTTAKKPASDKPIAFSFGDIKF